MISDSSIIFPNLHITLSNVGRSISIGSFNIYFYAIIIAFGMMLGFLWVTHDCERVGIKSDDFIDVFLAAIIVGIIGARIYYIAFSFEEFAGDPLKMINLRTGGLAIYGGIIGGFLAIFFVCHIKKIPVLAALDVTMPAVLIGQILGRWGNFFNREVFGGYSNGLLAMGIPVNAVADPSDVTEEMITHLLTVDGVDFITVHPTFLYESLWNLAAFLILVLIIRRHQIFTGEIFALYFVFYGVGRFWIEGVRTDRLLIPGTSLAVSQVLSVILVIAGLAGMVIGTVNAKKGKNRVNSDETDQKTAQ